jgi:hypothetical protein
MVHEVRETAGERREKQWSARSREENRPNEFVPKFVPRSDSPEGSLKGEQRGPKVIVTRFPLERGREREKAGTGP